MSEKHKTPKVIVGAFIFNDNEELLLLSHKKFNNKYTCPGGHLEINESLKEGIVREVGEELGIKIKEIEQLKVGEACKLGKKYKAEDEHHVYINFKALLDGKQKLEICDEFKGYKWQKLDEWKKEKNLGPNILKVLDELSEDSFEHKYKRALADYQNLLKQSAQEKSDLVKYANEQLLYSLIPVYDNLKTSLQHTGESKEPSPWEEGVKYVLKQFGDSLREHGLEEIEVRGKEFDPETMEAVEGRGEKVEKELRPGYKLNKKVIIPAKVKLEE